MLIYDYKGKKCPVSTDYWYNHKNLYALHNYNEDLFNNSAVNTEIWLRHVYNSFSTLNKFNNYLVSAYEVNENFLKDIDFVANYLTDNEDITNSADSKCRDIYNNLKVWYNRLKNNSNCLDDIKREVVKSMKHYASKEIFYVSSINLKRNYYDFV